MKKYISIGILVFFNLVVNAQQKSDTTKSYTLEEVRVQAKSILNKRSFDANKIPLNYLETPQVYNSVSRVVLEKQIATTIEDAMHNIPGVSKLWDATGRTDGGSYFTSRGFQTSTKARNGMANIASTNLDMANIERIEVIKGPSATLFGSVITSYGGIINRVTKKPNFSNSSTISLTAGTQDFYRGAVDFNHKFSEKLATRINGAWQSQDSWQDYGRQKSFILAPVITFKPSKRVQIELEGEFVGSNGNSSGGNYVFFLSPSTINNALSSILESQGLPSSTIKNIMSTAPKTFAQAYGTNQIKDLKVDYNRSFLNNDVKFNSQTSSVFGNVFFEISKNWNSQSSVTYSNTTNEGYMGYQYLIPNYLVSAISTFPTGNLSFGKPGHDQLARMVWSPGGNASNFEIQQNFVSDHTFGNQLRNRAVLGLDYSNFTSNITYKRFFGSLLGIPYPDVFDIVPTQGETPNYSNFNIENVKKAYATNISSSLDYRYRNNIYSIYLNDIFTVNKYLTINAGLRLDHFKYSNPASDTLSFDQTTVSPKVGIVVSAMKDKVAFFANMQNGFTNKNGTDINNKSFVPEEANQLEVGLKYNLLNEKLTGSISYYDVLVKNVVRTDVTNPNFSIQDGEQKSKGIEVELLANFVEGWTIMAGYGYNDSKFLKSEVDVEGRRPPGAGPKNSINFWTNYTFTKSALKGLGAGVSANYASQSYSVNSNFDGDMMVPAYTLLGTHVTYDTSKWKLGFKINNLTNEKYWMGWTNLIPQRPFQSVLTFGLKL